MVQIYEQVVSDSENKNTRCNFFCTVCKILINFTYIYSRKVLLFWQTEDVQN